MRFLSALLFLCCFLGACSSVSNNGQAEIGEDQINSAELLNEYSSMKASYFVGGKISRGLPKPKLELNPEVRRELHLIEAKGLPYIKQCLRRRDQYSPVLTQIFEDEGIPLDLLNLALIESGFNANARSSAGAVGLWQFMKSTGKLYGLKIGIFEDQRKDPILSTIAAARHLKDLYLSYSDWYLALAAYNAGSSTIDRLIIQTGDKNFWTLARSGRLNRQTAQFVPKFLATVLIVRNLDFGEKYELH